MRSILMFGLLALLPGITFAQSPGTRSLLVDVLDKQSGAPIDGLSAANFLVTIDGKRIDVKAAQRAVLRPRVVVLLDSSGSMTAPTKWNATIDLTEAIVKGLAKNAEVFLVPFSDRTRQLKLISAKDSIPMLDAARPAPNSPPFPHGRTALWDAMFFAIQSAELRPGDAVVIISDGKDNNSQHDFEASLKQACYAGVRVFEILLTDFHVPEHSDSIDFERLAEDTGGGVLHFGREAQGLYGTEFEISAKQQNSIAASGQDLTRRIVHPYVLSLDVPDDLAGKVKVEVLDNGKRDRRYAVVAQHRIAEEKRQ